MQVESKWHILPVKLSYFYQIRTTNPSSGSTVHLKTPTKLAAEHRWNKMFSLSKHSRMLCTLTLKSTCPVKKRLQAYKKIQWSCDRLQQKWGGRTTGVRLKTANWWTTHHHVPSPSPFFRCTRNLSGFYCGGFQCGLPGQKPHLHRFLLSFHGDGTPIL